VFSPFESYFRIAGNPPRIQDSPSDGSMSASAMMDRLKLERISSRLSGVKTVFRYLIRTNIAAGALPCPCGPATCWRLSLMHRRSLAAALFLLSAFSRFGFASTPEAGGSCPRPVQGSEVPEPADLRSLNGVLEVELTYRNESAANGSVLYCYIDGEGHESPNLRVHPGDLVILHLKNGLRNLQPSGVPAAPNHAHMHGHGGNDPCASGVMSPISTNLHFHGLTIPPVCHQDDVIHTSIQPTDAPFEYRFRIPEDGYWVTK
jgi:hypothetical protein